MIITSLNVSQLIESRFQIYMLTNGPRENQLNLNQVFSSGIEISNELVQQQIDTCLSKMYTDNNIFSPSIMAYTCKYATVLEKCHQSGKMLCLIMEDDIELIFKPSMTKFLFILNTLSLYSNEDTIYDCSKLGIGWFSSINSGNKLQCRIYPSIFAKKMSEVLIKSNWPADLAIRKATDDLNLKSSRFLMIKHTGGKSTLGHKNITS